MNTPDATHFREKYSAMDPEEIAVLWEHSKRDPDWLTEAAHEALDQVISDRRIDVPAVLKERNASIQADQRAAIIKAERSAEKAQNRDRALGKAMGVAGLLVSAIILCQRQLKTDPLTGDIASLKLTHPWRLSVG